MDSISISWINLNSQVKAISISIPNVYLVAILQKLGTPFSMFISTINFRSVCFDIYVHVFRLYTAITICARRDKPLYALNSSAVSNGHNLSVCEADEEVVIILHVK